METTVRQRLIEYLERKKIGRNKFESMAGLSMGYITKLKNAPRPEKLVNILHAAPDLNRVWLLTGEGSMLLEGDVTLVELPDSETATLYKENSVGIRFLKQGEQLMMEVPLVPYNALGSPEDEYAALLSDREGGEVKLYPVDKVYHGKYLTPDELEQLEHAEMSTDSLARVRDLFIFQSYTCMSYVDLASFDVSLAKEQGDGIKVYTARRGKTGQEFSFVILDKARAILDKYNGKLPLISNVKYNAYLKVVAQEAKIDKPITSHWARHTGATLLLNNGVDMEVVARILGHASTKQTRETYAKLLDKTIVNEMQKFEKKIKGRQS